MRLTSEAGQIQPRPILPGLGTGPVRSRPIGVSLSQAGPSGPGLGVNSRTCCPPCWGRCSLERIVGADATQAWASSGAGGRMGWGALPAGLGIGGNKVGMGTEPLRHRGAGDQGCSESRELVAMAPDSAVEGLSRLRPGTCHVSWDGGSSHPWLLSGLPHGWDKRQNLEQPHLPSPGGLVVMRIPGPLGRSPDFP